MTLAAPMQAMAVRGEQVRQRVPILGMGIDQLDREGVARRIDGFLRDGGAHQILTVNLDFLAIGARDERFLRVINAADLVVPDGVPVLWAAKYLGFSLGDRITGPDLIEMAVAHSQLQGSSLFFLGAAPGNAAAAVERLRQQHGDFQLAGLYAPPFGPLDGAEDQRIRRMITDARPDFLFVAFGCPKQDFWISEHADLGVPVSAGIGGSLDFLAGTTKRAPVWAQKRGLEWMFRLRQEPRRLAKRYLVDDVQVLGKVLLSRFRRQHEAAFRGDVG